MPSSESPLDQRSFLLQDGFESPLGLTIFGLVQIVGEGSIDRLSQTDQELHAGVQLCNAAAGVLGEQVTVRYFADDTLIGGFLKMAQISRFSLVKVAVEKEHSLIDGQKDVRMERQGDVDPSGSNLPGSM